MVQEASPRELYQPIRSVHKSLRLSAIAPPTTDDIFYVVCYADPKTQKDFVFWEDILQAFEEGLHARDGAKMVPFLRGSDLKILEPRRIAALPNTVLDVVVGGPLVDMEVTSPKNTAERPANVPMQTKKEKEMTDKDAAATSTCSYRQTYDPQATAMESHIDRLDVAPSTRVSQVWSYVPPPADKGFQVTYQSGGATSAHSLGPQEYPSISSPENSSWLQEYSTPGRDVAKATISASQGDKVAQASLGDMYKDGHGVYQDYQTAMDWYLKAASQGHPDGEYKVGVMHSIGLGVPQDYFQAMNWFLKAADQGHASAQYNVGLYYDVGRGVTRDYLKAEEWYQKAADQGNADAIKMLSVSDNNKKDLTVD